MPRPDHRGSVEHYCEKILKEALDPTDALVSSSGKYEPRLTTLIDNWLEPGSEREKIPGFRDVLTRTKAFFDMRANQRLARKKVSIKDKDRQASCKILPHHVFSSPPPFTT